MLSYFNFINLFIQASLAKLLHTAEQESTDLLRLLPLAVLNGIASHLHFRF
jgi:hypothetical protein